MKIVAILFSVLVAVNALTDEEQWKSFKTDFEKTYKSGREESLRFKIFQDNLRKIKAHNEKYENGESTWAMGVNQFTDLTEQEVHKLHGMRKFKRPGNAEIFDAEDVLVAEAAVDWRKKGAVLDVLNQGNCGSCYAFSGIEAIEGQRAIKHKVRELLSEQEFVDCGYSRSGCDGGWPNDIYDYVKKHGISRSSDYPYHAVAQTCRNITTKKVNVKITGTKFIAQNAEAFRQAVEKIGPISICLNAVGFGMYSRGIWDNPKCPIEDGHCVLIVGYGSENGVDYWIVKNSWGKSWGENGYIRIKRTKEGVCGMYEHGMFPVIQ